MSSIKIKDFFNGRYFEIPKYQRGFAWERQNIRDLFDDVIESIESKSNHYIGTIVLSKSDEDDELFYVVDGQQRITTITLIINALISNLAKKDSHFYHRFYIKESNRYRLTPLGRDNAFFTNVLQKKTVIPQNKSQRYLQEAIEEITFKMDAISDKLKFLKSIEKLEIMEFVENSEGDAIRIFQTVNDRGKPLSNMEKAKSLLIYFSNRYLGKKLDRGINDCFSDIFEIYDDIKVMGEELNITLIKNKDFDEDNLMRYHFVSYSSENYDPTAAYVLKYLKTKLSGLRTGASKNNFEEMEKFIQDYTCSLKEFFQSCKNVITRAKSDAKYFKLFSMLNLSATIYPLITKLEMLGHLEFNLSTPGKENHKFIDLIELIDVRIYKTRGTDPKADIALFTSGLSDKSTTKEIEDWLLWFNNRWMTKQEFQSNLYGSIYGNRALVHMFVCYCESLHKKEYNVSELNAIVAKVPTIEHILSQTPNFSPKAYGFKNDDDYTEHEDTMGNLTIFERNFNSQAQNKSIIEKVTIYGKSCFRMTKKVSSDIDSAKQFKKKDIQTRTEQLASFCMERWWC